jgi:hypothetical protein
VSVVQCVAPDISGPRRCGFPGPALDVTTDARGAARVGFPIHTGRVGTEPGLRCERRTTCGISVLVDGIALAPVVGFELAAVPGAEYDAGRLALGLALAGAFALAALVLGLTTRWRLLPDPFA